MRESFLPFAPPLLGDAEIDEVVDTLRSDWLTTGPKVAAFEEAFAKTVEAPSALAVNSGTAALHVGLLAAGVRPGSAVVTTTMTFSSTAHVIEHAGAVPLIVDIEPDTLNISPTKIEAAIEQSRLPVAALLPVHYGGQPCDMDAIDAIAQAHGIPVVEDAAHALPARHRERSIGDPSRLGVRLTAFSFYATKNITTGEGGMLTASKDVIEAARPWALHGMTRDAWNRYGQEGSWRYDVLAAGFKYNLMDIQAAIGLRQLERLDSFHARRREIAESYDNAFAPLDAIDPLTVRAGVQSAHHLYPIRLRLNALTIGRDAFIDELRVRKIGTSVHFIPIHELSYYKSKYALDPHAFPIANDAFARLVSLPIHPRMTDCDVGDVIEAVTDVATRYRR